MKCANCNFYWQAEGEEFARCHFVPYAPWDSAPCEYEDIDYVAVEREDPDTGEIYWELEENE